MNTEAFLSEDVILSFPQAPRIGVFARKIGSFIGVENPSTAPVRISIKPTNGKFENGYLISIDPPFGNDTQESEVQSDIAMGIHNLRNLLTVILGNIEFANDGLKNEKVEVAKDLNEGKIATEKAIALTQQLNDLLANSENRLKLQKKHHDIDTFMRFIRANYKNPHINFINFVIGTHHFDAESIESAIMNLISNAQKYGGGEIYIITSKDTMGNLIIEVKDEGPGISENPEELFRPYVRAENNKQQPGYGLGLNYCKIVCEKHNGTITASNNPGKGVTFRMVIPPE